MDRLSGRIVIVAALGALLVAAPAGARGGGSCDKTASVVAGTVVAIDPATGERREAAQEELRRGNRHPYAVSKGPATIRFQGVRYELAQDSGFLLGCFGETKAAGAIFPRLVLGHGRVEVMTAEGKIGAVSNGAAMAHPQEHIAMTFKAKAPTYWQLTVRKKRKAPGHLAVTPYAGPRKGTCRYVQASASLDGKANTARYDGKSAE